MQMNFFKYLFTLAAICILTFAASAAPTVKLYGTAGSYYVSQFYPTQTLQTDNEGCIEFKGTALTMGYVYASEDYKLVSVTDRATGEAMPLGADSDGKTRCTLSYTGGSGVYEFDVVSVPQASVKQVTFSVSATGQNIGLISMISVQSHTAVTPAADAQEVTVDEGETFQIRSSKEDVYLYSVVVNDEPLQSDGYGTWYYTPRQGDVAVILTDFPNKKVPVKVTLEGENVGVDIVRSFTVNGKTVSSTLWYPEGDTPYTVAMGSTVAIELNSDDYACIAVTLNGEDVPLPAKDKSFDFMTFDEAGYEIVISTVDSKTGIGELKQVDNEDGRIYNMQGIKVGRDNLPAGMYIVNGKLILIK